MKTNQLWRVTCKRQYTTQSTNQWLTINCNLIRIVLWNYAIIIRIFTLNQATRKISFCKRNLCRTLIKTNNNITTILWKNILQQWSRLLWKNKWCWRITLNREVLISYKLMTIAGNNSQTILFQIEINTIHHWAKLVLCCCKEWASQTIW